MKADDLSCSMKENIRYALSFSIDLFLEKTAALFSEDPDVSEEEKKLRETALLWGTWKWQRGDLAEKYCEEIFDDDYKAACEILSALPPTSREPDAQNSILHAVFEFDKMIEDGLKAHHDTYMKGLVSIIEEAAEGTDHPRRREHHARGSRISHIRSGDCGKC